MHAASASLGLNGVRNGFHAPAAAAGANAPFFTAAAPPHGTPLPVPPPPPIWSVSVPTPSDPPVVPPSFFFPGDESPKDRDTPSAEKLMERLQKIFYKDRFLLVRNLPKNSTEKDGRRADDSGVPERERNDPRRNTRSSTSLLRTTPELLCHLSASGESRAKWSRSPSRSAAWKLPEYSETNSLEIVSHLEEALFESVEDSVPPAPGAAACGGDVVLKDDDRCRPQRPCRKGEEVVTCVRDDDVRAHLPRDLPVERIQLQSSHRPRSPHHHFHPDKTSAKVFLSDPTKLEAFPYLSPSAAARKHENPNATMFTSALTYTCLLYSLLSVQVLVVLSVAPSPTDGLLCVAHLPPAMTEDEFHELVSRSGDVRRCFLMRAQKTGESKGYGFVEYVSRDQGFASKGYLNGLSLEGTTLVCDWLDSCVVGFQDLHSRCLKVEGLPDNFRDMTELRRVMSAVVSPPYCQIALKSGKPLDFGLVEFTSAEDAERTLLARQGFPFHGSRLRISFFIPGLRGINIYMKLLQEPRNDPDTPLMSKLPTDIVTKQLQALSRQNPTFVQNLQSIIMSQLQRAAVSQPPQVTEHAAHSPPTTTTPQLQWSNGTAANGAIGPPSEIPISVPPPHVMYNHHDVPPITTMASGFVPVTVAGSHMPTPSTLSSQMDLLTQLIMASQPPPQHGGVQQTPPIPPPPSRPPPPLPPTTSSASSVLSHPANGVTTKELQNALNALLSHAQSIKQLLAGMESAEAQQTVAPIDKAIWTSPPPPILKRKLPDPSMAHRMENGFGLGSVENTPFANLYFKRPRTNP
ncbi:unnamed protein product [Cyprideis torosa]|uniref:Uncharacterized protein n=1 Tax=Cyprideis torosa TaxID=163714 RepID=A0A7R8W4Z5_9CRUS|nr:unnamed protein product [Cyprideis torosa]CAG0881171.1 unnamed protein product [Cyprideis torosa]